MLGLVSETAGIVSEGTLEGTERHGALPIVFGPFDRPQMGFYHPPEGVSTYPVAVVLCNPIGFEAMSAHRTYRHLAERLAARGVAALRFDYDGTGDSAGQSDDPGRVRAWLGGVKAALSEVRARSGASQVALFGVRLGAALATLAAIEDGDIDALILWAPVLSGRIHVREIRAYRMVTDRTTPVPRRTDGGEEVAGYLFTGETLAEMSTIDLLSGSNFVAKRALVLPRNERSADETRFVEHLKARGMDARLGAATGFAGMMRDDPYEAVIPFETLDAIIEWLLEGRHPERRAWFPENRSSREMVIAARDGRVALRETPLLFGAGGRLFGILTEPAEDPAGRNRPVLCFLNVGANHHVGPHRMNVDLARDLASRGYPTFRLDAAGLGDSGALPGNRENRIYTKDSVADVQSAMAILGKMRGASRFVLIGLCSGAYLAFHAALEDTRVVGQVLLSPYAFEWKEGDPVAPTMRKPFRSTRFYTRALLDRRVWLRALRGDVELRGIAGALLERLQTQIDTALPSFAARLRGKVGPKNEVERAFGAMCDRGVESMMVLSFDDGGVDMVAEYLGSDARKMGGRKNFSFKIVDGADHTFKTITSQTKLRDLLTNYVESRFP
jgi:alpha-beta hydrolase superfamily lysophospholipase